MTMSSGAQLVDFLVGRFAGDGHDAQPRNLIVHLRVVNDFAEQKNAAFGIGFARGISQIDGALDAVAKAEFLRQFDGQIAGGKDVAVGADALDQFAAVMRQAPGPAPLP